MSYKPDQEHNTATQWKMYLIIFMNSQNRVAVFTGADKRVEKESKLA